MPSEEKPLLLEILERPLFAIIVAVVLSALGLSGRFSVTITQVLLALAFFVGIYGLFEPMRLRWSKFLVSAAAWALFLIGLAVWARPETIPAYFGELIPDRHLLFSTDYPAKNYIEIGDSGSGFVWVGKSGKPIFDFYGSPLTIETIGGRVKVSTEIKNARGELLVELVRNQWRVSPAPNTFDRNYTDDALEVRNAEGRIILQVKSLPDRVQLQGEWHGPNGQAFRMLKGLGPDGKVGGLLLPRPNGFLPSDPEIVPIFEYPSDAHFGKLRKAE